jgi:hypothetical protein
MRIANAGQAQTLYLPTRPKVGASSFLDPSGSHRSMTPPCSTSSRRKAAHFLRDPQLSRPPVGMLSRSAAFDFELLTLASYVGAV